MIKTIKKPITGEKRLKNADKILEIDKEIDQIEADFFKMKHARNEKKKELELRREALNQSVLTSVELYMIECEEIKDIENKRVKVVSVDDGEIIEDREMTETELEIVATEEPIKPEKTDQT